MKEIRPPAVDGFLQVMVAISLMVVLVISLSAWWALSDEGALAWALSHGGASAASIHVDAIPREGIDAGCYGGRATRLADGSGPYCEPAEYDYSDGVRCFTWATSLQCLIDEQQAAAR